MSHPRKGSFGPLLADEKHANDDELEAFLDDAQLSNRSSQRVHVLLLQEQKRTRRKRLILLVVVFAIACAAALSAASYTNKLPDVSEVWSSYGASIWQEQDSSELPYELATSNKQIEQDIDGQAETALSGEQQDEEENAAPGNVDIDNLDTQEEEQTEELASVEPPAPSATSEPIEEEHEAEQSSENVDDQLADTEEESTLSEHPVSPIALAPLPTTVDMQPDLPSDLFPSDPSTAKYLAYLPHSGFHNQRIEMANALMLASMLNRTLIVPKVRLGRARPWDVKPRLEAALVKDQKKDLIDRCKPTLEEWEHDAENSAPRGCTDYTIFTEASWSFLANLDTLPSGISILPRPEMRRSWFTDSPPEGLGLSEDEIEEFTDETRYDLRYYEDARDRHDVGKYARKLTVADLSTPELAAKRLLYLGSIFGGGRVLVSSKEARTKFAQIGDAFVIRNKMLDPISREIVSRLGGKEEFVGVHCRVGDGAFKQHAKSNMETVFRRLAMQAFGLSNSQIDRLTAINSQLRQSTANMKHSKRDMPARYSFEDTDGLDARDFEAFTENALRRRQANPREGFLSREEMPLASSLQCRGELYTDPELIALNRPIYMATDNHSPLTDPNFALFFNTFPCIFLLADFAEQTTVNSDPIRELTNLETLRNQRDGLRSARFLYPFLEAEVVSHSNIAIIGTPGSTFSAFAAGILHKVYGHDNLRRSH